MLTCFVFLLCDMQYPKPQIKYNLIFIYILLSQQAYEAGTITL